MPKSNNSSKSAKKRVFPQKESEHSLDLCSNTRCPSHWQRHVIEKITEGNQLKLQINSNKCQSHKSRLPYSNILSKVLPNTERKDDALIPTDEDWKPEDKSVVLDKFQKFVEKTENFLFTMTHAFTMSNLENQLKFRSVSLVDEIFSVKVFSSLNIVGQ